MAVPAFPLRHRPRVAGYDIREFVY